MSRASLAWALLLSISCADPTGTWNAYELAGEAACRAARYDKAEALLQRALALAGDREAERVRSLRGLARLSRERGDLPAARERLAAARGEAAALPARSPESVELALEAAWLLLADGEAAQAADAFERAGDEARSALGDEDPAVGWAAAGRGEALRRAGDRAGARKALEDALALHRSVETADHVRPADTLGLLFELTSLGALEREEGHFDAARALLRTAVTQGGKELGNEHPRVADALTELARTDLELGDRKAALRAASRAAEVTRTLPQGHPSRVAAAQVLARCAAR